MIYTIQFQVSQKLVPKGRIDDKVEKDIYRTIPLSRRLKNGSIWLYFQMHLRDRILYIFIEIVRNGFLVEVKSTPVNLMI